MRNSFLDINETAKQTNPLSTTFLQDNVVILHCLVKISLIFFERKVTYL